MTKYEKIAASIEQQIDTDVLHPGSKLPSIRKMIEIHRCSPGTVLEAYRLLSDKGRIESKPQSGFYVKQHSIPPQSETPQPESPEYRVKELTPNIDTLLYNALVTSADSAMLPFGVAAPGPALIPAAALNKTLHHITSRDASFAYTFSPGLAKLRIHLAVYMNDIHVKCTARNILLTSGCTRSVFLSLKACTSAGDAVLIESPCYSGYPLILEALGLKGIEVPASPDSGVRIDAIKKAISTYSPKAFITSSAFANPLGYRTSIEHQKEISTICNEHDIYIVENDIFGDIYFSAYRPVPYKSLNTKVFYCSSFSKSLAPALRCGWIVPPPEFEAKIARFLKQEDLAANTITQQTVAEFLKSGKYTRHCRELRKKAFQIKNSYCDTIEKNFPTGTIIHPCHGGLILWIELPQGINSLELQKTASAQKLSIAPGPLFSVSGEYKNCIRIGFGYGDDTRMRLGLQKLGNLIKAVTTECMD